MSGLGTIQGCCLDVQGWIQESQDTDDSELGQGCEKQDWILQICQAKEIGKGQCIPSEEIFYSECGEALEQAAQKSCGCSTRCPRPGGWNPGQPNLMSDLVAGNPATVWELEMDCLRGSFQPKPLYD